MILWRAVVVFVRFWVDFVVGDDWMVAAAVGCALLGTWALVSAGLPAWWLVPLVTVTVTGVSLRRAVAQERSHGARSGNGTTF
jgi:hypothetical protein